MTSRFHNEGYKDARKHYAPNFAIRNNAGTFLRNMNAIERAEYQAGYAAGRASLTPRQLYDHAVRVMECG